MGIPPRTKSVELVGLYPSVSWRKLLPELSSMRSVLAVERIPSSTCSYSSNLHKVTVPSQVICLTAGRFRRAPCPLGSFRAEDFCFSLDVSKIESPG